MNEARRREALRAGRADGMDGMDGMDGKDRATVGAATTTEVEVEVEVEEEGRTEEARAGITAPADNDGDFRTPLRVRNVLLEGPSSGSEKRKFAKQLTIAAALQHRKKRG